MKKFTPLLLLFFATVSFASFSFTLLNVTTDYGHGCQYYMLNESVSASAIPTPAQSFNQQIGTIRDGEWNYLATVNTLVWQPDIVCISYLDVNRTARQSCADRGKYVNTTTQQWQPYTSLKYFPKPTELEYCADYTMQNGAVSIDVVPTIGGHSFPQFAWFNASWGYKAPCYINTTVSTSLKNFPSYCVINTQSLISAGKMKSDCSDLRAVNSSESRLLNYEIVNNTCNTTSTYVWVGIPATTAGGTDLVYIYYGNPAATNAQNASGLWTAANYSGVYHTAEKSGSLVDSAGSNLLAPNVSGSGSITYSLPGPRGFGLRMNGTSLKNAARFKKSNPIALPSGSHPYTITWWQNKSTNDSCDGGGIFSLGSWGTNTVVYINQRTIPSYYLRIGYGIIATGPSYTPYNSWQFFAINNSGSTTSYTFKNGTLTDNGLTTDGGNIGTAFLQIGGDDFSLNDCNDIAMSEIRIRNVSSSTDWIAAQYGQISSMGAEQRVAPLLVSISSPANATYTVLNQAVNVTCTGDSPGYLLNITDNGNPVLAGQAVANHTLFPLTNTTFPVGAHVLSATCWNGSYRNSSMVTFTIASVYFVSPTPANNTDDLAYPITFEMASTAAISDVSYVEIDGTNQTCASAPDNLSCSYVLPYASTLFNHTYSAKGWACAGGVCTETNETRVVPYYGCGYVNANATLRGDISTATDDCLTINASGITVDGQEHTITGSGNQNGLSVESQTSDALENINVTGFDNGFSLVNSESINLTNDNAYGNNDTGFYLYSASSNTLINSTAYNNLAAGFYSGGVSTGNIFINDDAHGNSLAGFGLEGASYGNALINNTSYGNSLDTPDSGFDILTDNNSFIGNIAHDNGGYGGFNIRGTDNTFIGNTAYNHLGPGPNGERSGFRLMNNGNRFINDTAYNNQRGFNAEYTGDNLTGEHYYDNTLADFDASPDGYLMLSDVIIDNPLGNFQNFTNLSLNDSAMGSMGDLYAISWSSCPDVLPDGYETFANKFVRINVRHWMYPGNITSIAVNWLDSELSGYNESKFLLVAYYNLYNNWTVLNDSPDTVNNRLSATGLDDEIFIGILQNDSP